MADQASFNNLTTRQKITAGIIVIVMIILIWQVIGLFRGGSGTAPAAVAKTNAAAVVLPSPQAANLTKAPPLTEREIALQRLQQETQAKYLAAMNELQVLKISKQIAETNQAIMTAKLATVTAEKNIVDLLQPAAVSTQTYSQALAGQSGAVPPQPNQTPAPVQTETKYTVISVSQLRSKWNAVIGNQGNLYNVSVGDVLPPDRSVVIGIDKTGVLLEKDGNRIKVSLVPVI